MKSWDYLTKLMQLPPRGSGTENERKTATWLERKLSQMGYDTTIQRFKSPRHTLYAGPVAVNAVLLLSLAVSGWWPLTAACIALITLLPLAGELLGNRINFDLLLPKSASQNVIGCLPGTRQHGQNENKKHIVVVAHYDTQWGSWLFSPAFRPFVKPFFMLTYGGVVLGVGTVWWRALAGKPAPALLTYAAATLLVLTAAFLLGSLLTGRAVHGANDNGSGVAVALALAHRWQQERPQGMRITFLFTGSEEVGMRGMHHFLKATPPPPGTMFVNIDNVGGGRLRYLLGEGMVGYVPYDAQMIAVARELVQQSQAAVEPLRNLLLPTDALLPAKDGYAAITFLAAGDKDVIPNYHWHSDTLANVDRSVVEKTESFVWQYIHALAAMPDNAHG